MKWTKSAKIIPAIHNITCRHCGKTIKKDENCAWFYSMDKGYCLDSPTAQSLIKYYAECEEIRKTTAWQLWRRSYSGVPFKR